MSGRSLWQLYTFVAETAVSEVMAATMWALPLTEWDSAETVTKRPPSFRHRDRFGGNLFKPAAIYWYMPDDPPPNDSLIESTLQSISSCQTAALEVIIRRFERRFRPRYKDHVWSYDFVHSRTHTGRAFRMLMLIDEYMRKCLAIDVERKLNSEIVLKPLSDLFVRHGVPDSRKAAATDSGGVGSWAAAGDVGGCERNRLINSQYAKECDNSNVFAQLQ